jgi:hypothetical protein
LRCVKVSWYMRNLVELCDLSILQYTIFLKLRQLPVTGLARTCLAYLEDNAFDDICLNEESMETRVQTYRLCLYAAQFWVSHTRGEAEHLPSIQQAVLRLLASENKRDSMLQLETYANSSWGNIHFRKGQTLLHVICKNGLETICRFILDGRNKGELQTLGLSETDTDVGARDEGGETALHWAARNGQWDMVKWLVNLQERL